MIVKQAVLRPAAAAQAFAAAWAMQPASAAQAPAQAPASSSAAPDGKENLAGLDPERLRIAREIIDMGFPAEMREAMFLKAVDAMTDQARNVQLAKLNNDPQAKAMVNEAIDQMIAKARPVVARHVPAFMEAYARGYAREFSRDDLLALHAFVDTPAGRRFMSRSANILDDPAFRAANETFLHDLEPVMEAEQKALFDRLMKHLAENPPEEPAES